MAQLSSLIVNGAARFLNNIYGNLVGTINGFTVGKSVPSDAKFTDTWTAFSGASASSAGTAGYVPAPAAGDQDKYFKGDGTWAAASGLPSVTSSDNGKILQVVDGRWSAVTIPNANGGAF